MFREFMFGILTGVLLGFLALVLATFAAHEIAWWTQGSVPCSLECAKDIRHGAVSAGVLFGGIFTVGGWILAFTYYDAMHYGSKIR